MHRTRASTVCALVVALVAAACSASDEVSLDGSTTTGSPATTTADPPGAAGPGDAGIGDPYYPGLGNGGYDVTHYVVDLDWSPATGAIDATTTIRIVATEPLTALNLDLVGLDVALITVDGTTAAFARDGRELAVTLPQPLDDGQRADVVVDYSGRPEPISLGTDLFRVGWHTDGRDAFVVSEPAGAATWFPGNDHPRDKATFEFVITAPADLAVVAAGSLRSSETMGDRTTWIYDAPDLMATYLASVVIGDLVFGEVRTAGGVPIRDAYPERLAADAAADFASTDRMLEVFQEWFGPYPFTVYGHVVVDEELGFALENQTLSLFGTDLVAGDAPIDRVLAHELAHQWFGNAVSPSTWQDVWLNEGFATYAEWIWEQESGGAPIAATAERLHASADYGVAPGDPGPDELFQPTVYVRGGLALHALSVEIGDAPFRRLLTAWVERHDDSSASTADLRALAEELSGRDLEAFFDAWIYDEELPPLP